MKQKNLILMVVAVGCGLVAAFLTTQINAKPKVEKVAHSATLAFSFLSAARASAAMGKLIIM